MYKSKLFCVALGPALVLALGCAQYDRPATEGPTVDRNSCASIEMSPQSKIFDDPQEIRAVRPLYENRQVGKAMTLQPTGAEVVVHAKPGMTAEWLQRVVECDIDSPTSITTAADSPLALQGVEAEVRSVGDAFAVRIRSEDRETAKEIVRRAQELDTRTTPDL